MEDAYRRAGVRDVETRVIPAPLRLPAAECLRFEQECFGALHEMLAGVSEAERAAAWVEIGQEFAKLVTPAGFESPAELLVGAAAK
jgi:hypothetical protein